MDEQNQIKELMQEFIEKLGFDATIELSDNDGVYHVHVKTEDEPSMLIGKHARMLGALQRVVSAMLFKKFEKRIDILLDVNDYRESQQKRLTDIADNVARRVMDEGREARLSSFSAYERRIIHEHIGDNYQSLESHSEGDGGYRQLIITQKES